MFRQVNCLKPGSAQYTYHQLLENEMIERITLTMDNPPIKDTAVLIAKQIDISKYNAKHREWLLDSILDSNAT